MDKTVCMRLDIQAQGFWGGQHWDTFFHVKVFNPHVPSNDHTSLEACYQEHEGEKRGSYEQQVREIERGTFARLVFLATGGTGLALLGLSTSDCQA